MGILRPRRGVEIVRCRQSVPALATMVTLASGLAAIEAARVGRWDISLGLILLAMVADGVDGPIARRLHATSEMGGQLDSLADIVAFAVAPAFLFSTHYAESPAPVRLGVALAFVLAGAYRLARFHAQPTPGAFSGLPTTVAGPLLGITVGGPFETSMREAGAVGLALAALMVCHHPFPTLARSRRWFLPAIFAALLPVALWPRIETLAIIGAITLGAYVFWSLVVQVVTDDVRRTDVDEVRRVVGRLP